MITSDFSIRLASKNDVDEIQKLIKENPKTIVPRKDFELAELLGSFWVAVNNSDSKIIGCVCLEVYSQKICEIRTLIVHSEFRNHGVGKALMEIATNEARKRKIPQIMVITSDPSYFEKLNFGPDLNEKYALFFQGEKQVKG